MISIKELSFSYKKGPVLQNLTIDFEENSIHGIVGLNGSGKTTLFNILCGYLEPDAGSIISNGNNLKKSNIAYIDTESFFYPKLSGREFLSVFKSSNNNYNEDELASVFNLPLDELIEDYSTGMKKKLLIISQLKQDKKIYVFDEPFNGLDIESNKSLVIILELLNKKGKTVFVSSHIIEPLFNICHKIHHLKDKSFVRSYTRDEYDELEHEVFGHFTEQLRNTLSKSL